jgi:hypothetical protein
MFHISLHGEDNVEHRVRGQNSRRVSRQRCNLVKKQRVRSDEPKRRQRCSLAKTNAAKVTSTQECIFLHKKRSYGFETGALMYKNYIITSC